MRVHPIRVLIVDDDEGVLIELEHMLESEGYRTATAWSGREALALAENAQFDLLLIDEHLADMDAGALLDQLRERHPDAARFVMQTRREDARKGPTSTHAWVCKWHHADLKAAIRNCLAA
jgi:CheY-like chemotaxis protein